MNQHSEINSHNLISERIELPGPVESARIAEDVVTIADAFVVTVVGGLGSIPGAFIANGLDEAQDAMPVAAWVAPPPGTPPPPPPVHNGQAYWFKVTAQRGLAAGKRHQHRIEFARDGRKFRDFGITRIGRSLPVVAKSTARIAAHRDFEIQQHGSFPRAQPRILAKKNWHVPRPIAT